MTELALVLRAEGYSDAKAQLTSRSLKLQLKQIWTAASLAVPTDAVKLD
ncbi:hypothetical protein [Phenylobacterium sp.]|nr:hypothetical protein [Phenylobacterium sp.]MDP3660964.1 hypothetical protein [Phenylobacterium sp.]